MLGLFVVGRLARRHTIGVTLLATPGGGVTATLQLPAQLMAQPLLVAAVPAVPAPPATPELSPLAAGRSLPAADVPAVERVVARAAVLTSGASPGTEAVTRAIESVRAGDAWNAFVPRQRPFEAVQGAQPLALPAADSPAPPPPGRPVHQGSPAEPGHPTPPVQQAPPAWPSAPAAGPAPVGYAQPTGTPAGNHGHPELHQRVPGAHLPGLTAPVPYSPVPPPVTPAPHPGEPVPQSHTRPPAVPAPGGQKLHRRVPGVALDQARGEHQFPTANLSDAPGNPADVRDLVDQFEAGVLRALAEVRDIKREEGPTR